VSPGASHPLPADVRTTTIRPTHTMGRAAEMLDTAPAFLRAIGEAGLIVPLRSDGGHRRYPRCQLRIAARAGLPFRNGLLTGF
jgi:hypothetical protein